LIEDTVIEMEDHDAPINHIKSLAFNRSTSSIGETKAVFYIEKDLKSAGISTKVQYFSFVGPIRILMRITYVILLTYLVLYRLVVIIAFYLAIKYMFARTRNYSLVKKENSKNLIAMISAKNNQKKKPVAILSAHLDSFSANLPYKLQNVLFIVFRVIIIPYFVITLGFSVWIIFNPSYNQMGDPVLVNLVLISSLTEFVIIFLIFILIFNTKKSMGSIDNASGVAILMELTKLLEKQSLKNIDVITVFTGAEEWGLIGSKRYCERNRKFLVEKYDLNQSFNINVDMVGTYIGLVERKGIFRKKQMNRTLNTTIEETAQNLNIAIVKHHNLIEPKTDHKNFKRFAKKTKSKFQIACLHSDKDSKYIHSPRDTPDKCNPEVLNNAVKLIFNTLKQIDSQINTN
jgi:hypothetical protein